MEVLPQVQFEATCSVNLVTNETQLSKSGEPRVASAGVPVSDGVGVCVWLS